MMVPDVKAAFDAMPSPSRLGALELRNLILDVAEKTVDCPTPHECLRWGQPSYVTPTGTPLRIGIPPSGGFALYAHCQTTLIRNFAEIHGADFKIEGNRGVHFKTVADIRPNQLCHIIAQGLMYKVRRLTKAM